MTSFTLTHWSLLLLHGLMSVALLGAVSHQTLGCWQTNSAAARTGFLSRYASAEGAIFAYPVVLLFLTTFTLGALIYPEYRLGARYAIEEMRLLGIVGLFELKEHCLALCLGLLPLYVWAWRHPAAQKIRALSTTTLAAVLWFSFLVGHLVNNVRGL